MKPSLLSKRSVKVPRVKLSWTLGLGALLLLTFACSDPNDPNNPDPGGSGSSATSGGQSGTGSSAATGGTAATATGGGNSAGGGAAGGDGAGGSIIPGTGGFDSSGSGGGDIGSTEEYPFPVDAADEDGSDLWLRYPKVPIPGRLGEYQAAFTNIVNTNASSATLNAAQEELVLGLSGLTGAAVAAGAAQGAGDVVIGKLDNAAVVALLPGADATALGDEGYLVQAVASGDGKATVVTGKTDIGVLYGTFALLRHLQTHSSLDELTLSSAPKIKNRILDHWDNLDGSVERGYAGKSIWNWSQLPGTLSPRYKEYARANASIGINGVVLTNVNATKNNNEDMWTMQSTYLPKVKALADLLRPYGIRVYLTAPFNAGGTADPKDAATKKWWVDSMNAVYASIPDFGGLLIKASSEGEPGPSNGATHADGANMLATAIGDRGIVMWRAFVYGSVDSDRIAQAYEQFKPLDGKFADNVFLQVKNGALDFQPREPFHQLFGAMPKTKLAVELQITKEYLGEQNHLAYLGPLYEEVLKSDTYASGAGSTVARVMDGSLDGHNNSAIAGVSNIGNDTDWTGSHFNQANWYVFGRMAWNPDVTSQAVAQDWVRQTFSNDPKFVAPVVETMMMSREGLVRYMAPLGLVHIMGTDHHYGPGPWINNLSTAEWNPFYYHKADATGIGFDRTSGGSGAITQYNSEVAQLFGSRQNVPEQFLLFFQRVAWSETAKSGRTIWQELVHLYSQGVDDVATMRENWASVDQYIDDARYKAVTDAMQIQHYEARWWRDACLTYFASVNKQAMPAGYAAPAHDLAFYQGLTCPSNVDKPRCSQIETGDPSPAILP